MLRIRCLLSLHLLCINHVNLHKEKSPFFIEGREKNVWSDFWCKSPEKNNKEVDSFMVQTKCCFLKKKVTTLLFFSFKKYKSSPLLLSKLHFAPLNDIHFPPFTCSHLLPPVRVESFSPWEGHQKHLVPWEFSPLQKQILVDQFIGIKMESSPPPPIFGTVHLIYPPCCVTYLI